MTEALALAGIAAAALGTQAAVFLLWHTRELGAARQEAGEQLRKAMAAVALEFRLERARGDESFERMADRLQARHLSEYAAVRHPEPAMPEVAQRPYDADWENPDFSRPMDPGEQEEDESFDRT